MWSFTLPGDVMPPSGVRTAGRFYIMPGGPNQSGSTVPTGKVWVADAAAPGVVLAQVDASKNIRLVSPLKLDTPYLLFITRPEGLRSANDFYFVRHDPGWGNPLELEVGTGANDTAATAEVIELKLDGTDEYEGFIEGDLVMSPQDVDHFLMTVPETMTKVHVSCAAQRVGSGLRGFNLSLLAADGSPLPNNPFAKETEMQAAGVSGVPLGGAAQVVLKVGATSQDPTVTEAFYACGVHFTP